jgi:hypothetical protein
MVETTQRHMTSQPSVQVQSSGRCLSGARNGDMFGAMAFHYDSIRIMNKSYSSSYTFMWHQLTTLNSLPTVLPFLIPHPMAKQQIQPETQQRKCVLLEALRVRCAEGVGCGEAGDDGEFVGVHESPCSCEPSPLVAVQEPHPGYNKSVVCPAVAELMPPVDADYTIRSTHIRVPQHTRDVKNSLILSSSISSMLHVSSCFLFR